MAGISMPCHLPTVRTRAARFFEQSTGRSRIFDLPSSRRPCSPNLPPYSGQVCAASSSSKASADTVSESHSDLKGSDQARNEKSPTLKMSSRGIVWSNDETEMLIQAARKRIGAWHPDMMKWRRDIHSYPELAFQESRTSDLVASLLESWGYSVDRGLGGTGVVGSLTMGVAEGETGRAIMLRADMDALPIQEDNQFEHKSKRDCVMHACGHDGHTAMLLGAARKLSETKNFRGTVHLVFQPAEEGTHTENEGGRTGGGAAAMLDEGLLEKFPVEAAFGLHNWPGVPVGRIAVHSGPVMAGVDTWEVEVIGIGCHAAMPHLGDGRDPVLCAAHIVTALQALVSRVVDPLDSAVLSVTQMHGGDANNVIPTKVLLSGTIRSFTEVTRTAMMTGLKRVAVGTAQAFDCTATVTFLDFFPATVNTKPEAALCARAAEKVLGKAFVDHDSRPPSMGAEDFGYILQRVPGSYIWLGNGPTLGGCMLHNPLYDFNDDILAVGASYWVQLVEDTLPL